MTEKTDPILRLRLALRDRSPADDPDDFAELVSAFCAVASPVTIEGAPAMALASRFDLDRKVIADWSKGVATPTPRLRREVTRFLTEASVNLGVREGG